MAAGYCAKSEAALSLHVFPKRGFHYSRSFQSFVEANVCGLNVLLEDMKDFVKFQGAGSVVPVLIWVLSTVILNFLVAPRQ